MKASGNLSQETGTHADQSAMDIASVPPGVGSTIGVEEEFHILDPSTAELTPDVGRILNVAGGDPTAEPELQQSSVETATAVCHTLAEVRAELIARRRTLREFADEAGLWVVAAGTVPDAGAREVVVYPTDRYRQMAEDYQYLVSGHVVCAGQVQVGVPDRDLAVALATRVRPWLPVLLALSASSPFFQHGDTGYASYRTVAWSRWPTAGPAPTFRTAAEYDDTVHALIRSGVITDPGMVYFDIRASARYPTVEIRIADACPLVDDVVLLTALGRAMVVAAAVEEQAGVPMPEVRPELLRAATWRAARSGMTGDLVDPVAGEAMVAAKMVDRLLDYVRPCLQDRGEWDTVADLVETHRSRGTSADRQRAAYARRGRLRDVVDLVLEETAIGS